MVRLGLAFLLTFAVILPATSPARALERDGLAFASAIRIDAANTTEGIAQEYAYLRRVYPGWRRTMQALVRHDGRIYDRLTIVSPANETRAIYFDITSFFGKM